MSRRPDSQKAFTLIEVMLAATVLLVGITSMIYVIGMGTEMLDTARKSQIAQQIIDGEITRMRLADWGTGTGGTPGTVSYPNDNAISPPLAPAIVIDQVGVASGQTAGDEQRFALTNFSTTPNDDNKALMSLAKGFTITLKAITPKTDYRIFSYTVQWASTLGKTHSRSGVAYIGRYGLSAAHQR